MKIALIVNPCSGGKNGKKYLPQVIQKLTAHGIGFDTFISQNAHDIFPLGASLEITAYDAVVAMGGDGTNFHMLNGLLAAHAPLSLPPLGILPVGSGNSFARDLGIHTLEQGIQALVDFHPRPVDVISFSNRKKKFFFANLMGLGFVTDVARTAEKFKYFNDFSYIIGVIFRTLNLNFHYMALEIDGILHSGLNCFVEFCNSQYTGGSMLMAPGARIDDGLMDIVIAAPLSRQRLLAALPKIYKGTHIHMPEITCIQAKKAIIITQPCKTLLPDGEILGTTPAIVEVIPKLVRYLV